MALALLAVCVGVGMLPFSASPLQAQVPNVSALLKTFLQTTYTRVNVQVFTATGAQTYTPTTGMQDCLVISTGAGGGSGSADTSGGSGDVAAAGGGGAGGTCIESFTAATIGASQPVTVGVAGTAGGLGGGNGGNGGATNFGALHTANGGTGGTGTGTVGIDSDFNTGGAGGTGSGGTLNITGGSGSDGMAGGVDGTTDLTFARGGYGGVSWWGGDGRSVAVAQNSLTTDLSAAGVAGAAYGSGASGSVNLTSTTTSAAAAGANGVIMVIEFINE